MKKLTPILLALILFGCSHFNSSPNSCQNLKACLALNNKLTGKSYLYEDNIKLSFKFVSVGNVLWTTENADFLLGELLGDSGYYRLPTKDADIFYIINARDIRYISNVPTFKASKTENDPLPSPNASDSIELIYTSKNGLWRPAQMARNLRAFMSRYGRIIDHKESGIVIVRDTSAAVHKLLPLMRQMDVPISKEEENESRKMFLLQMEIAKEEARLKRLEFINKLKNSKPSKPDKSKSKQ